MHRLTLFSNVNSVYVLPTKNISVLGAFWMNIRLPYYAQIVCNDPGNILLQHESWCLDLMIHPRETSSPNLLTMFIHYVIILEIKWHENLLKLSINSIIKIHYNNINQIHTFKPTILHPVYNKSKKFVQLTNKYYIHQTQKTYNPC